MDSVKPVVLRRVSFEIFIFALTILSLFNLFLLIFVSDSNVKDVAASVNGLISFIFLIDFLFRLRNSESKRQYFIRENGWLDLLGSVPIPGFNLARIWRLIVSFRQARRAGAKEVIRDVARNRADTALIFIALAVIYLLEFGSIFILRAEDGSTAANITSAGNAIWWVIVTISTIGYGDYYPVTVNGRFVAIFVIIAGVGVFSTLSGYLAKIFLGQNLGQSQYNQSEQADKKLEEIAALLRSNIGKQEINEQSVASLHARLDKIEQLIEEYLHKP